MATTRNVQVGKVDRTALRVNQAFIVGLLLLAFLMEGTWLVAVVAIVMGAGTVTPSWALFQRFYRDILRPTGLLKSELHAEDPAPHRFAQGMGAAVLVLAILALALGATIVGWSLVLIVVILAAFNLIFGFCAGCFIYFQAQRMWSRSSHG